MVTHFTNKEEITLMAMYRIGIIPWMAIMSNKL